MVLIVGVYNLCYNKNMKFYDAIVIKDSKESEERRFRNILANSGQIMESGDIRDLDNLYVMGRDGKPIAISALDKNPDKQTEEYSVKAQADHGATVDGELIDTIEKQFGSCKVWLEEDGLHARMYFANNDALADHAWAISEDASYSTGIDWFPDGYYGVGLNIDQPIGILREISMVLTGNDPRAKTIDNKGDKVAEAKGSKDTESDVCDEDKLNEGESMAEETKDNLTPDESKAIKQRLAEEIAGKIVDVVDDFTTTVPESETEPTADEVSEAEEPSEEKTEDAVEEAPEVPAEEPAEEATEDKSEEPTEETKDAVVHNINVNLIRDRAIKNEGTMKVTKDTTAEAKVLRNKAIKDALNASNGHFNATFDSAFANAMKTADGITGIATPVNISQIWTEALEKSDGILAYFNHVNTRGLRNNALSSEEEYGNLAQGHKKGDDKADEALTDTIRVGYCKMVYKKLSLDALEIYENPELLDFRAAELVDQIIASKERAAVIGDGRTYAGSGADYRMFDSATNTGLFPIAADCAAQSGYGTLVASSYDVSSIANANLYDGVVGAREFIRSAGAQILIVKPSVLTAAFQAKVGNRYLIEPGATAEDIFRVDRVFSPLWMEYADDDAYLLVRDAYTTYGEQGVRVKPFFDVSNNQDILLDEAPTGGMLTRYKGACAIKGLGGNES